MTDSISSFATIATLAPSSSWQKMLVMNPERAAQEWRTFLAGGFLELAQAIGSPEPAAPGDGLSDGVKLRTCPKCGERPVRGPNRGECNACHALDMRERRTVSAGKKRAMKARGLVTW